MYGIDFISPFQGLSHFPPFTQGVALGYMDYAPLGLKPLQPCGVEKQTSTDRFLQCQPQRGEIHIAQGNALGKWQPRSQALKGRNTGKVSMLLRPFRACSKLPSTQGFALGYMDRALSGLWVLTYLS